MKKNWKKIVLGLLALFVLIQFIPVSRTNPPVTADLDAPAAVKAILTAACYDCHSNQTTWPAYSYIAPISWLIASDVHEARDKMNFSTWGDYNDKKQVFLKEEVWSEVRDSDMPPALYKWMHPKSRIHSVDEESLREWSQYSNNETSVNTTD